MGIQWEREIEFVTGIPKSSVSRHIRQMINATGVRTRHVPRELRVLPSAPD